MARGWLAAPALTLALTACGSAMGQIYSGPSGADAGIVLSNFRSAETPLLLVEDDLAPTATAPAPVDRRPATLRLPAASADLNQMIADIAAEVQISPELLHAVIAAESRYNPRAVSARGAIGLMQLMPATATRFGAKDPYAARQNIVAGASYLKWLMVKFQNNLEIVLAAYNAGEQAVVKAGGRIPPYPETLAYVPRVLAYLRCANDAACKPA